MSIQCKECGCKLKVTRSNYTYEEKNNPDLTVSQLICENCKTKYVHISKEILFAKLE